MSIIEGIPTESMELNYAGLWEIGVMLPFSNCNFSKFEQVTTLNSSVSQSSTSIRINDNGIRMKAGDRIYIGPSSDKRRDSNNEYINYKEFEVFSVDSVTYNISSGYIDIDLASAGDGFLNQTEFFYNAEDPVIVRGLAKDFDYLDPTKFLGIIPMSDYENDSDFSFSRQASMDGYKNYSQQISTNAALTDDVDVGLSQIMEYNRAKSLQLLQNKPIAISVWARVQNALGYDPFDLTKALVSPYVIIAFFNRMECDVSQQEDTYLFTTSLVPENTQNIFLSDRFRIPKVPANMRIGLFGRFTKNPDQRDIKVRFGDFIVEHCAETTQEENGRYRVDTNPTVGISVNNQNLRKTNKISSGIITTEFRANPSLKVEINATWKNKPGYFVEDFRKLEYWNRLGYPIVLRTKMPSILPNVVYCNMEVRSSQNASPATSRSDISVIFTEISI